jgi:hypothetical protein
VAFKEVNKTKVRDEDAILEIDKATSLTLLAYGEDPESKIKKAAFLVDGNPSDPKAAWIPADRYSDDGKYWIAQKLDFPFSQETVVVYVKFTNGVDLESKPVKLVIRNGKKDVPKEKEKTPTTGTIEGKVVDGDRLVDTKVRLLNEAGDKELKTVDSKDGKYTFTEVEPGKYRVKARDGAKSATSDPFTVKPGETTKVDALSIRL